MNTASHSKSKSISAVSPLEIRFLELFRRLSPTQKQVYLRGTERIAAGEDMPTVAYEMFIEIGDTHDTALGKVIDVYGPDHPFVVKAQREARQ